MQTATLPETADRPETAGATNSWRYLMSLPRERRVQLRWQVARQIKADDLGAKGLGISEVDACAVAYLEDRRLIVSDDGWRWREDLACSCGRNKAGCDFGSTIGTGWAAHTHGDRYP